MSFKVAALDLAKRGFRVFPLRPGEKKPLHTGWQAEATADPLDLLDSFPENCNPGIFTEGLVVLDADVKHDGLENIKALGPLPRTYTVATARGGRHYVFQAPKDVEIASRACQLRKDGTKIYAIPGVWGVDVRAKGGLIAGAGSVFEGKPYTVLVDAPFAELPAEIVPRLVAARPRALTGTKIIGELDTEAAKQRTIEFLREREPAVEGSGGDTHTYQTACRVLDFGVSFDTALELMLEHWDVRNSPPWGDDLAKKVMSAWNHRQDPIGRDNPVAPFDTVEHPKGSLFRDRVRWYDGTLASEAKIPPRPWLVEGRLIRKAVTVLGAPGSAGKSLWSLQMAVAVAIAGTHPEKAHELVGIPVKTSTKVLVINNEDPDDELDRRLAAVMTKFDVPRDAIHGRLVLYSGVVKKFKVTRKDPKGAVVVTNEVAELREFMKTEEIGFVALDPLVSIHTSEESNNTEMQAVMEVLTSVTADCNASGLLIHHVTKPQQASAEQYAGNVNAIRGASAIKDAARVALTMFAMSKKDGESFGIPAQHRHRYVRLDDAKANLHLATAEAQWFYKESVKIANDEWLGVLKPVDMRKQVGERVDAAMRMLCLVVSEEGIAITKAAEALVARAPEFREYSVESVKSLLLMGFEDGPYAAGGTTYTFERSGEAGGRISIK